MTERVLASRARQRERGTLNAILPNVALKSVIADLAGVQSLTSANLAEALQCRVYETRRTRG